MSSGNGLVSIENRRVILSKSFAKFYDDKKLIDVRLMSEDGHIFTAHRFVLSAVSPYFRTIFKLLPFTPSIVYLKGIKKRMLKRLLELIYYETFTMNFDDQGFKNVQKAAEELKIKFIFNENSNEINMKMVYPHHDDPHSWPIHCTSRDALNDANYFLDSSKEKLIDAYLISKDYHMFPVHRIILSAVSSLFRDMFDMKCEDQHHTVFLHGIVEVAVDKILQCVYGKEVHTGSVNSVIGFREIADALKIPYAKPNETIDLTK